MRVALAAAAVGPAIVLGGLVAPSASAAPARVEVEAVRVAGASGRPPVLRRGRIHRYRVVYRVAGAPLLRVTRAGALIGPGGRRLVRIRPPARFDEPGRYLASGRLRMPRRTPRGRYALRYTVAAAAPGVAARRAQRTLLIRLV